MKKKVLIFILLFCLFITFSVILLYILVELKYIDFVVIDMEGINNSIQALEFDRPRELYKLRQGTETTKEIPDSAPAEEFNFFAALFNDLVEEFKMFVIGAVGTFIFLVISKLFS